MKSMNKEQINLTSALPHESAAAADTTVVSPQESGFGAVVGGTAIAVQVEAEANTPLGVVTLDSPHPLRDFSRYPPGNIRRLAYNTPTYENGKPMTQTDMIAAYSRDSRWMEEHVKDRSRPGKHVIFTHHTVGTTMEPRIQAELNGAGGNSLIVARYHSPLLAESRMFDPEFYAEAYGNEYGQELWDLQRESLQHMGLVVFSTDTQRRQSIEAVAKFGLLPQDVAEERFATLPIPLNFKDFSPDTDGTKRQVHIENVNQLLQTVPQTDLNHIPQELLSPDDHIFGYVGRFDHEKGIWPLIDAYADFLTAHKHVEGAKLGKLLAIGGLTNKPGILERHAQTLEKIKALPPHLQKYIVMPLVPAAHQDVIHAFNFQVYNSLAETFDISEKQARAAEKAVFITDIPAHMDTNIPGRTAYTYRFGDPRAYQTIFEAAMNPQMLAEIARQGHMHAMESFSDLVVCEQMMDVLKGKYPAFFQ